ncbi:hypothetical protein N0V83_003225 [Neocucurbitaria cava]|uniref:F-box domain-containing protein n=1 Tax=Neocucurbitaria cava TaxID=798079 RepID=A0A9W8YBX2_9PLEO|nr:hypothetical protein N0V83_003225 [Neocucurbitaria cava]
MTLVSGSRPDSAIGLASLPTELIELIASSLDLPAFHYVRLTCSSIGRQTLHHFKERFFRTRTLRWTNESLDLLVEVTNHVDYGDALQHLIIDATPRNSIHLWQTCKRISEAQAILGSHKKSPLEEQYLEDHKVAEHPATFFKETRYDQKCLTTVFMKLDKLENIIFEYEGMNKRYGKFGRRYCESSQHEMSRPFVSTMAAIAATDLRVKVISISPIKNHGAISIGRLESLAPSLRHFDSAFERLEVLCLNLRDWRYPDSGFELDTYRAPFVVRFLAKARNVRQLDLNWYSNLEDDLFGEIARHCTFARLESCKLSLFRVNHAADLSSFLAHSNETLRVLSLYHASLCDEESTWQEIFRELASSNGLEALEEVELVNLFTRAGSRIMFDEFGMKTRLIAGIKGMSRSWRAELLSRINDFRDGTTGPAWHLAAVAYPFVGLRT